MGSGDAGNYAQTSLCKASVLSSLLYYCSSSGSAPFYRVLRGRGFGQDLLGWDLQEQCLRLIAVGAWLFVA